MSKELLQKLYTACDPEEPANKSNYVNCNKARGGGFLTERFLRHLEKMTVTNSSAESACTFLFSGHVGCGKSSELRQLEYTLLSESVEGKRFYPVVVNFLEYMDDYDFGIADLLLTIVTELASVFREKLGIELKDNYFEKRLAEAGNFLKSEIDADHLEIGLFGFKTKLQRMKIVGAQTRADVRAALNPHVTTMAEEINTVFAEARGHLRRHKPDDGGPSYDDFVLILDDLEKVQGFEGKERGIPSHRELFLENSPRLKKLKAHVIYTVPLELIRFDGAQLEQKYVNAPFVLPMVKIEERNGNKFIEGYLALHQLLGSRVGGLSMLASLFHQDALEFLIKYSGGHVRNLLRFIREASAHARVAPITLENAEEAIGPTVRLYSTSIPDSHWEKLARLEFSKSHRIDSGDADFSLMLKNLNILEYINGGQHTPFKGQQPWYIVNPIVRELDPFISAIENLRQQSLAPASVPVIQTPALVPVNNP